MPGQANGERQYGRGRHRCEAVPAGLRWHAGHLRRGGDALRDGWPQIVLWLFFEGNDLNDLTRELRNAESFRANGQPWERRKQVSLVKEIERQVKLNRRAAIVAASRVTPNAMFITGKQEIPMTV